MLVFVAIVHIYFYFLFLYSLQGKERPAQTNLMPAKLRAVLACAESDSAQCEPLLELRKISFADSGQC